MDLTRELCSNMHRKFQVLAEISQIHPFDGSLPATGARARGPLLVLDTCDVGVLWDHHGLRKPRLLKMSTLAKLMVKVPIPCYLIRDSDLSIVMQQ